MGQSSPTMDGKRLRPGALLLILAAFVALCVTGWRYFAPLSGVAGTGGALLAMFGAFMLMVAGLLLLRLPKGRWRSLFIVLAYVGIVLTLLCELFLHGWWSAGALAVGIIAIVLETFTKSPERVVS